jgi:hypothetical protein
MKEVSSVAGLACLHLEEVSSLAGLTCLDLGAKTVTTKGGI